MTSPNISAGMGDAFTDGQLIDTITPRNKTTRAQTANPITERAEPVWDPIRYPHSWRAVWHYSHKRALHDRRTLTAQENKARAVVAGEKTARNPRFVTTSKGTAVLNEDALTRAKQLVGLKGYVTNIPITAMPGQEAIEAHLTIVFTALAIARQLQTTTGISIKRLIRILRPLRQVTIQIAGQTITAQPHITPDTTTIIEKILGH